MWKLQEDILTHEDLAVLTTFINSTSRFTQHVKVKEFEHDWSGWQGSPFSVFVNSGSSADLIMLDAVKEYLSIEDDAEVLVPAVTWTTNITSVIQAKLKPVFVDINLEDLSFDYEKLEQSITPRTKIILVTHLIGIPADMGRITEIAERHGLTVLEDCCESHGAQIKDEKIGNFGLASTFSFYWGHHLTTVEGGILCTANEELYNLFLLKRSHGLARELPVKHHDKYRKLHPEIDFNFLFLTHGYNFRNTEFNAVLGIHQLPRLDFYIRQRNDNYAAFLKLLEPVSDILYLIEAEGMSSFCLPFIFKDKNRKYAFQRLLAASEIESRPIIGGNLLRQPCFSVFGNYHDFPVAELIHNNGFYIGNNQFVDASRLGLLSSLISKI
jgi:CDP-4-dehydro-6-deoxyglucose reductase, E1